MTSVGFINAFEAKWGWFQRSIVLERQNSKHKTPTSREAGSCSVSTHCAPGNRCPLRPEGF